jgi:hypothetical protein
LKELSYKVDQAYQGLDVCFGDDLQQFFKKIPSEIKLNLRDIHIGKGAGELLGLFQTINEENMHTIECKSVIRRNVWIEFEHFEDNFD